MMSLKARASTVRILALHAYIQARIKLMIFPLEQISPSRSTMDKQRDRGNCCALSRNILRYKRCLIVAADS